MQSIYKMKDVNIISLNMTSNKWFNDFQAITFINNVVIIFIVTKIKTHMDFKQLKQQCITFNLMVQKSIYSITLVVANNITTPKHP